MERQIAVAIQSLQNNTTDATNHHKEKQLMQVLKNMDDSYFATLQGSYNMWQEVRTLKGNLQRPTSKYYFCWL